ncbi:MAG TPA: C1 family peptidase, partial [Thermoleophilia bacterium]|nr:C1 family peptidase [Thermoleophilia bacterium]
MRESTETHSWILGLLAFVAALLLALLLAPSVAGAASREFVAQPPVQAAPLNPDFVLWQARRGLNDVLRSADDGHGLGARPAPHALFTGRVPSSPRAILGYVSSYDLRTTGKLTSVKDQGIYGTCWSFATYGSLESCLLPGESADFSEDNMVLTSGFNYPGTLYDAGGQIWMSTAYLARWNGPIWESEDAYGDSYTPGGLSARKHVQDVSWYAQRSSATDNDRIKYALTTYGATYISMSWQGSASGSSYYNPTTHSYYYNSSLDSNHAVLIVGWDDTLIHAGGTGGWIVKNSYGTGWGDNGYFTIA